MSAKKQEGLSLTMKWALNFLLPLIIFLIPTSEAFTLNIKLFFAITIWAISMWVTDVAGIFVPALLLPVFYLLSGIITPQEAFSSWQATTVWIVFGGMLICEVFQETGLMKRISYISIVKSGATYRGIIFGLTVSGFILAFLVPTVVGRAVIYAGLTYGLCVELNIPAKSKTAAGIMLGGYFAAANPAYVIATGSNVTLIGLENLRLYDYDVTFSSYFIHMGPLAILWGILVALVLPFVVKQDAEIASKEFFKQGYAKLGKASRPEKKALTIVLIAVTMVSTSGIHGIDPAWCFIIGAAICFVPALNIADQKIVHRVNYPTLIFITSCLTIGMASSSVGASKFIADIISPFLSSGNSFVSIGLFWAFSVIANFVMTPLAAISSLSTPMIEIAMQIGVNPIPVIYAFIQGLEQLLFPYEVAPVLITFSFGMISMKDFTKVFVVKGIGSLAFLMLVMVPYWKIIGLM